MQEKEAQMRLCTCNSWTPEEEKKIHELMDTEIVYEGCQPYKPARPEAIRLLRCLETAGKWCPTDDPCQRVIEIPTAHPKEEQESVQTV